MTRRIPAAFWLTGLGLSSGAGALGLFALTAKMNWAGTQGTGFAVTMFSITFAYILGVSIWLVIFTKVSRKAN
jgi:hypothetical protein